jgi:hypothetical protein
MRLPAMTRSHGPGSASASWRTGCMDITGARWGLEGAEATLKLRCLIANGDFENYWRFHLRREHERVHHTKYRDGQILAA